MTKSNPLAFGSPRLRDAGAAAFRLRSSKANFGLTLPKPSERRRAAAQARARTPLPTPPGFATPCRLRYLLLWFVSAPPFQAEVTGDEIRALVKKADEEHEDGRYAALHSLFMKLPSCRDKEALKEAARAISRLFGDVARVPGSEYVQPLLHLGSELDDATADELAQGISKHCAEKDDPLTRTVLRALGCLIRRLKGKTVESIAQRMIAYLEVEASSKVHEAAISILGDAGPNLKDEVLVKAIATVGKFMQSKETNLRFSAAWVLAKIGPGLADKEKGLQIQETAAERLTAFLEDESKRLEASLAFQDVGPCLRGKSSEKAADALTKYLEDKQKVIRSNCCAALTRIVPTLGQRRVDDLLQRVPEILKREEDDLLRRGFDDLVHALVQRDEALKK